MTNRCLTEIEQMAHNDSVKETREESCAGTNQTEHAQMVNPVGNIMCLNREETTTNADKIGTHSGKNNTLCNLVNQELNADLNEEINKKINTLIEEDPVLKGINSKTDMLQAITKIYVNTIKKFFIYCDLGSSKPSKHASVANDDTRRSNNIAI